MTLIQIIDAFTFYGLDVIVLAAATCLTVQLLKITLLKKCQKKVVTFLPFIIGGVYYAAYAAAVHLSVKYVLENYVEICEHGFSVGALSTLLYVWYEQFVRGKKAVSAAESVIKTLIEGYVPDEKTEETANKIVQAIERDVTGGGAQKTADIILSANPEELDEAEVKMLARLIIDTLAHMNTQ